MNWLKRFWKCLTEPVQGTSGFAERSEGDLTPRAQRALASARKEADRFNHNFVGTEHLLLGLIAFGQGVAINVLRNSGLDLETVQKEVERQIGTGPDQKVTGIIPYTPRLKKVLALADKERRSLGHKYLGTEHILLGILREGDGIAGRVLKNLGLDIEKTRQEILKELDPNFVSGKERPEPVSSEKANSTPQEHSRVQVTQPSKYQLTGLDTSKRYDVYCSEQNQDVVVYRNALFKGVRTLFHEKHRDTLSDFFELEQADGQTIFVAKYSVIKFCDPGVTPDSSTCE